MTMEKQSHINPEDEEMFMPVWKVWLCPWSTHSSVFLFSPHLSGSLFFHFSFSLHASPLLGGCPVRCLTHLFPFIRTGFASLLFWHLFTSACTMQLNRAGRNDFWTYRIASSSFITFNSASFALCWFVEVRWTVFLQLHEEQFCVLFFRYICI